MTTAYQFIFIHPDAVRMVKATDGRVVSEVITRRMAERKIRAIQAARGTYLTKAAYQADLKPWQQAIKAMDNERKE